MADKNTLHIPKVVSLSDVRNLTLTQALEKVKLDRKDLPTDVTHGTEFYVPVNTLLAKLIGTRREDVVYVCWPVLGCPFFHFASRLPAQFAEGLAAWQIQHSRPPRLWEVLDLLQSGAVKPKWSLEELIELVRAVESFLRLHKPEILTFLAAAAAETKTRHDREGMLDNPPGMTEGIVIDATGPGRVN